jgi:hypothetical protein
MAAIDAVVFALIDGAPGPLTELEATAFAQSRMELSRIRAVRSDLLAALDPADLEPKELRRLSALDRYERVALTNSRRIGRLLAKRSRTGLVS